jgi:hypothetical protein
MKWQVSRVGNLYTKQRDCMALIQPAQDGDGYRLQLKVDFTFEDEDQARDHAEAMLDALEEAGLTKCETY